MPVFRPVAAFALLSVLAACQQGTGVALPWQTPSVPPVEEALAAECPADPAMATAMDEAINALRQQQGKTNLTQAPLLARIAQSHACDMARTGRLGVEGSNGSSVVDRARAVGYPTCGVVQLVAQNGSAAGAVALWNGQEAQRTELLGQPSRQIGSGSAVGADGRIYWSVVLGDNCR